MRKRSGRPPRFAQVPNETVDDSLNLDLTALGLLTVFLRHRDGWDITLATIGKKYGYGEDAMANAMGMLQIARYVVKVRIMGAGNLWRTEMAVYAPPARDAEVEELLAAIRQEDSDARRVEIIAPTATAIKRTQKRREKLAHNQASRPASAPSAPCPAKAGQGQGLKSGLVGTTPAFAGVPLRERGFVYLAFHEQHQAFKLGMCRSDRFAARTDELTAGGWTPMERKEFPSVEAAYKVEQLALDYLRRVREIPPCLGPEEMALGWTETVSAERVSRQELWSLVAGHREGSPTRGIPGVGEGDLSDSGVSRDPENPRVPYKTVNQETKGEKELAPPARSAGDVRRTTNGSSACTEDSGCAATEKPSSAGEGGAKRAGGVPVQRAGDRKPSPFRAEIRQAIYATESLLPGPLRAALAEILPHGHLPNVNRLVTAQALETRTPAELGERAARRWISYGYERDHYDGLLRSPLGIVEELLRPTPFCPLPDCEDGRDRHTRMQCSTCEERIEQRKRDRKAGRKVATARPTRLYRDREECDVCSRPLKQGAAPGDVCPPCQAELDQSVALILGGSLPDAPMPDPADAAYAPAPPSSEYREWREQPADDGAPF